MSLPRNTDQVKGFRSRRLTAAGPEDAAALGRGPLLLESPHPSGRLGDGGPAASARP